MAEQDTQVSAETKEADLSTILTGSPNDGNIIVRFSQGDFEAHADLNPPVGDGAPISEDYVNILLNKLNITYGVRWDVLNEAVSRCNLHHKPLKNVPIALGVPPVNEVDAYFELNPHLRSPAIRKDAHLQIDYHAYSPFTIVKQNQILAQLRPRETGIDGKNIHGDTVPFVAAHPQGVTGGENTRTEEKYIFSAINGQLIQDKNVLHIRDFLVIKGGVNYTTGNIIFPGDVTVEGPVSDGFKIYSGGSITIKQTFDVTEAIAKKDLTVNGGIIGRGRALVKVGGTLRSKFIENCRLAARSAVCVEKEIINSSVFTMEKLDLGDKGLILGGDIYAIHGVRAGSIGKKGGRPTHIHCGVDFVAQQEKETCNNQLRVLAAKLAKLRELMGLPGVVPEKMAKMEELLQRLTGEQQKISSRISELMIQLNADENAVVEVNGEITSGTLIEICQIALFVPEPLRKVRIKLDKEAGRLIHEPL